MSSGDEPQRQVRRARPDPKRSASESRAERVQRVAGRLAWLLVVVAMVALVFRLRSGNEGLEGTVLLEAAEVEQSRQDAGCGVVATAPVGEPTHLDDNVDVGSVDLGEVQPPPGGPHRSGTNFLVLGGIDRQIDVLSLGHNLEHGAVVAWYDPAQVDSATVRQMEQWSEQLNNSGFAVQAAAAGIFVAPFEDPGISSGQAIALRSWTLGVDCGTWDETAANSFVVETYGAPGGAPEGGPFPDGTLAYTDEPPTAFRDTESN